MLLHFFSSSKPGRNTNHNCLCPHTDAFIGLPQAAASSARNDTAVGFTTVFKAKSFQNFRKEEMHVVPNIIIVFSFKKKKVVISKGKALYKDVVITFTFLLGCYAGTWVLTHQL